MSITARVRGETMQQGYEAIWQIEDWLRHWQEGKEQITGGSEAMQQLGLVPRDDRPHDISIA